MATSDVKTPTYSPDTVVQPVAQQQQPAYAPQPPLAAAGGEWQHDIFDCFEPQELCLKATFCPCFVFGKTQARLRDPSLATYERFNADCALWSGLTFCCGVGWAYQFLKRKELRQQYSLRGDDLTDCLYSWILPCCSLIQQDKEVVARQTQAGVINQQGYIAPKEGMTATSTGQ